MQQLFINPDLLLALAPFISSEEMTALCLTSKNILAAILLHKNLANKIRGRYIRYIDHEFITFGNLEMPAVVYCKTFYVEDFIIDYADFYDHDNDDKAVSFVIPSITFESKKNCWVYFKLHPGNYRVCPAILIKVFDVMYDVTTYNENWRNLTCARDLAENECEPAFIEIIEISRRVFDQLYVWCAKYARDIAGDPKYR